MHSLVNEYINFGTRIALSEAHSNTDQEELGSNLSRALFLFSPLQALMKISCCLTTSECFNKINGDVLLYFPHILDIGTFPTIQMSDNFKQNTSFD